jgi:hypothetical protein
LKVIHHLRFRFAIRLWIFLLVATLGAIAVVSADSTCDYNLRPPTAVEKKAYADAFASFQRMAPPAPAGWESTDSAKDNVYQGEVCAAPGNTVTSFTFSRSFKRNEGMAERAEETTKKAEAMVQNSEALQKANAAKLTAIRQQEQDLVQKSMALVQANKLDEVEAVNKQIEKLQAEEMKLMGVAESDAASKAIEGEARKDTYATFSVTTDVTDLDTTAYKPMPVPEGKGYRQDYDDDYGNPISDFVIALKPAGASGPGQTVVRVSGDRQRAEALLKAVKLH